MCEVVVACCKPLFRNFPITSVTGAAARHLFENKLVMQNIISFLQDGSTINLLQRFGIDAIFVSLLLFGLYFRRYRDKELVTVAALFNVFVFSLLSVLSSVEFSMTSGFGLFAVLALFTVRSEQISKTEITYFFGSVAIAVICSVRGTSLPMVVMMLGILLFSAYLIDHPGLLPRICNIRITFDKIDDYALSDQLAMQRELSRRLGVDVLSYHVTALDYINDMARIDVSYRQK